jgi:Mg2+ and Co2+ transporter CorA
MYTQVGPVIAKSLDEYTKEVQDDLKKADDMALASIHQAIEETEMTLSLKEDYQNLYHLTDEMAKAEAEALTQAEEHKYREAIVKKLDSLYALEEAASSAVRSRMVNTVKADVVKTFSQDKKAKESALNQAIAILAAGEGAKIGKDVVGEAFVSAVSNYRSAYSKLSPDQDEILVQLQKDMAAVAQAPVVEAKGGNVYATI